MPDHTGMEVADAGRDPIDRLARDRTVTAWLSGLDETELCGLLTDATALGTGIGGTTASIDVAGGPVFVKRVPPDRPRVARRTPRLHPQPVRAADLLPVRRGIRRVRCVA
ncbi:hypothetical protein O7608_30540 [Solwaraspora sp. WMMA2056]|uniref:hypothetical protein n=1 Tax=Solwaraspora sp. WMMA2056 TaxID=3015161 RepID=UPI00259B19B9|nr:hypothetical protein [Solwaraspora sp. WMMA2056]WJK40675.1 hypothetical protein O7608_30540 [Solwaraspora sp. WMMA2056]